MSSMAPARSTMRNSGGAAPGLPTMPTDEISFCPENSSCWAPGTVRYTLSWAARAVRSSTSPTTRSFEAPTSMSAPTGRPIVVDTATSSGCGVRGPPSPPACPALARAHRTR